LTRIENYADETEMTDNQLQIHTSVFLKGMHAEFDGRLEPEYVDAIGRDSRRPARHSDQSTAPRRVKGGVKR